LTIDAEFIIFIGFFLLILYLGAVCIKALAHKGRNAPPRRSRRKSPQHAAKPPKRKSPFEEEASIELIGLARPKTENDPAVEKPDELPLPEAIDEPVTGSETEPDFQMNTEIDEDKNLDGTDVDEYLETIEGRIQGLLEEVPTPQTSGAEQLAEKTGEMPDIDEEVPPGTPVTEDNEITSEAAVAPMPPPEPQKRITGESLLPKRATKGLEGEGPKAPGTTKEDDKPSKFSVLFELDGGQDKEEETPGAGATDSGQETVPQPRSLTPAMASPEVDDATERAASTRKRGKRKFSKRSKSSTKKTTSRLKKPHIAATTKEITTPHGRELLRKRQVSQEVEAKDVMPTSAGILVQTEEGGKELKFGKIHIITEKGTPAKALDLFGKVCSELEGICYSKDNEDDLCSISQRLNAVRDGVIFRWFTEDASQSKSRGGNYNVSFGDIDKIETRLMGEIKDDLCIYIEADALLQTRMKSSPKEIKGFANSLKKQIRNKRAILLVFQTVTPQMDEKSKSLRNELAKLAVSDLVWEL